MPQLPPPTGSPLRRAASAAPARRGRAPLAAALLALLAAVVVVLVLVLGSSAKQLRSHSMESLFQDDQLLLYAPTPTVTKTLDTLRSLGVDRLRVTVLWLALAPDGTSTTKPPHFDPTDPGAYLAQGWAPYDRLVRLARARGIALDFNVSAPGPLWAMGSPAPSARLAPHYIPDAKAFGSFVTAVGRRYSGSYVPPDTSTPLPRVSYWAIWNEPNQPGWLAPQWRLVGGSWVMSSPVLYRSYADAAINALAATGHRSSSDTILIGELAPEGSEANTDEAPMPPLPFLRGLYCVDNNYRPLRGTQAATLNCPTQGSTSAFVAANPGLFDVTGFAHHPYEFFLPPNVSTSDQNFVPLADLPRLEGALDRIFSAYGVHRQLPIYLTEYGYETNPPNPFRGVSLARQATYLSEAQYLAWRDPRVRSMAQFLLVDSAPDKSFPPGSIGYWSTFQTGLQFLGGARKPSFNAYRLPIFLPKTDFHSGSSILVWGMLRLAPNGTTQHARIQWRGAGQSWRTLATVTAGDPTGSISQEVGPPGSGLVRVEWTSGSGTTFTSQAVRVREVR